MTTTNLAYELPLGRPREVDPRPQHVEVVSTRAQRRARPKAVYAVVAVAGLFAILIAQLLISIVLSDNAYRISSLQSQQKELVRDQQGLTEDLQVLQSPQNLSARAADLGMVLNTGSAGWIRLSDHSVLQAPTPAGDSSSVGTTTGDSAIANSLITPDLSTLGQDATATEADSTSTNAGSQAASGAPAASTSGTPVTSDAGGLPSPTTH